MPSNRVYAFGEPQNDGERRLIRYLDQNLPPDGYRIYHNLELQAASQSYDYDVLVMAPHAMFCLEAKDWRGRTQCNDRQCRLENGAIRDNPYTLIAHKSRVLKSRLVQRSAALGAIWVEPIVVIVDEAAKVEVTGGSKDFITVLPDVVSWLTDGNVDQWKGRNHRNLFTTVERVLTDDFRPMAGPREVGQYRLTEQVGATALYTEWRAVNRHVGGVTVRLKIYAADPYLPEAQRKAQMELISRDFKAATRLGRHQNLLLPRDFFPTDGSRYVVVTDDPAGSPLSAASLAGRSLTFEQKLTVISELTAGLAHAHLNAVVHRDVRPANVYMTPTGAVLLNFDCARVPNGGTIHEAVAAGLDPRYLAPEVRASAANATASSDVYSVGAVAYELLTGQVPPPDGPLEPPSSRDPLIDVRCDSVVSAMLSAEPAARPTAAQVREELDDLRERRHAATKQTPPGSEQAAGVPVFAEGDIVDGQYLVRQVLGEGSFGRVYRVYHAVTDREYAMKVFRDPGLGLEDAQQEFVALVDIDHPRIARVRHAARLAEGAYYLLTTFVSGDSLADAAVAGRLTPREALRCAAEVLEALAYLHTQGYVHRDVKPSNIMLAPNGAVLIDFSTAVRMQQASGRAAAGTPFYAPPDVASCELEPQRDLFAVGALLFELLTGEHPYAGVPSPGSLPRDPAALKPELTPSAIAFLRRSVAPRSAERYASAETMVEDLRGIGDPVKRSAAAQSVTSQIAIPEAERGLANTNPYLSRFLTLYSQNRQDNSGTRGYDEISRATYVRTYMDERLAPDLVSGRIRLAFITGNAGDGKTAFLQNLEERLSGAKDGLPQTSVAPLASGNGASFEIGGRKYRTNYDGSQDEGVRQNDEVLEEFLAPFAGDKAAVDGRSSDNVRLLAINEGKLRDFLARRKDAFPWLKSVVIGYLDSGQALPGDTVVVNLNDRCVACGTPSIVEQQIEALCNPTFWETCGKCELADRCPVKANVDTMCHPDIGPRARHRIERLYQIVHLRGQQHLTMRAVRSTLAYMLFGEDDCAGIARNLSGDVGDAPASLKLLNRWYYNALAAERSVGPLAGTESEETDRLLRALAEADPGLCANPGDDRDLQARGVGSALLPQAGGLPQYDRVLLRSLSDVTDGGSGADGVVRRQWLHAALRRKAYFERPDDGWEAMLPYTSLRAMLLATAGDEDTLGQLKTLVTRGVNSSEGLAGVRDALVQRVAHGASGRVRSYRRFATDEFRMRPGSRAATDDYVEFHPSCVELVYRPQLGSRPASGIVLRVGLDMLEMLARMAGGYIPSASEWRGPLVNLMVFRSQLAHEDYSELLLVDVGHDKRFTVARAGGRLVLSSLEDAHATL